MKELETTKQVIKSLNTKLTQKSRPVELVKSWDIEGKGFIDHNNLKTILNGHGYHVNDNDVNAIMALANPNNNGKVNTGDIYNMIKKEDLNFEGLN
jgi:Ca2+-binding EF-hand superfamily protein